MFVYKDSNNLKINSFDPPCWVNVDSYGRCLDLHSGAGAFYFGYPQLDTQVINYTNFFIPDIVKNFILQLENISGYYCPILLCSGSEANEAALLLTMKYFGGSRNTIMYMPGCFFGRTYLANMSSNNPRYSSEYFGKEYFCSFFDRNILNEKKDRFPACIIMERYPSISLNWDYNIGDVAKYAHTSGALVVVDETKGGFRTGNLFSFHNELKPDIVTMSKSLCSGFPVSAVLVSEKLLPYCNSNWYTTTTGGHQIGCQIGLSNLSRWQHKPFLDVDFQNKYQKKLVNIFQDRIKIVGKYISIGKINGIVCGEWFLKNGFLIYSRNNFISLFPNMDMLDEFEIFLDFSVKHKQEISQFFI